ncbi:hypothetical protein CCR95_09710 [Thiocystis minor]|nr:hypothetical protein [Thiocystis minor]
MSAKGMIKPLDQLATGQSTCSWRLPALTRHLSNLIKQVTFIMKDQPFNVITVAEFCDKYRIDRATYYRNAKLGRMPATIKVGGSKRILVSDEEAWLAQQRKEAC